jgi:hypothetical protein
MNFAIIKDNVVINTVIADSKSIAESITNETCVQYLDNQNVYIGGTYNGTTFTPPKPFASFIYNEETNKWDAPIAMPVDGKNYRWSENNLSWETYTPEQPYASWILNTETFFWEAPIAKPDASFNWEWNEPSLSWVETQ